MSQALTIQDRVFSLEKEFNEVNSYKMNFLKEAQFALQLLKANEFLLKTATQDPASLEYAIINLASIGISLNPALKEAYLVPRGGKVCLDISYIGLTKLATDKGGVEWIQAEVVKKQDSFEYQGIGKAPLHKMNPFSDRGETIGVYCVARLPSGESLSTIMSKQECDTIRDKCSKGSTSWKDFYEEMLKKTVIKRASKLWPKSERVQKAAAVLDEHEGIDFNSKAPHMDAPTNTDAPTDKTFANIRALLKAKNEAEKKSRTEDDLLDYISVQSKTEKKAKLEDLNSAEIEYVYRILGGSK
jgi:recombination protein RecT